VIDRCCTCDATTAVAADGKRLGRTPTSSSRVSISAGSAWSAVRARPLELLAAVATRNESQVEQQRRLRDLDIEAVLHCHGFAFPPVAGSQPRFRVASSAENIAARTHSSPSRRSR
jgi:hypothetical protein